MSNPYFHGMIAEMDQVVSSLLGSPSLKELPAAELKHLTLQYPYASFLHLLRSRKLKDANDPEYPASVAMTALYFNNPHWLHHQLQAVTAGSRVQEWEKAMAPPSEEKPPLAEPDVDAVSSTIMDRDAPRVEPEEEVVGSVDEGPLGHDTISGKLSDILKAPVDPDANPVVPIEPLYTVDYFASLGIRANADQVAGDALGQKLKSFTEWLKAMRKINPEKVDVQLDAGSETRIRQDADLSNAQTGIVTETMAEVLQRQGLRDKAIELYDKLSLLEPAKSAYFAAKIKELKDQQP